MAEQEVELYDGETIAQLQAFADGVNAYIMGRDPGNLALEYGILGLIGIDFNIEPWTPADPWYLPRLWHGVWVSDAMRKRPAPLSMNSSVLK